MSCPNICSSSILAIPASEPICCWKYYARIRICESSSAQRRLELCKTSNSRDAPRWKESHSNSELRRNSELRDGDFFRSPLPASARIGLFRVERHYAGENDGLRGMDERLSAAGFDDPNARRLDGSFVFLLLEEIQAILRRVNATADG